ncbi:CHAT domain-containing protein [Azohydromonas australica]|uniref:CHAT domain-containing protein n=1 Tax=Azohydromonas australica TaxID=364039 RepID=UPI000403F9F3|nr:CHAT domain-containing protein [Azohydromonas australica]
MAQVLEVQGWEAARKVQPAFLNNAGRSADAGARDELLPDGLVEVTSAVLVGPASREAGTGVPVRTIEAADGEVLLLELEDGSTLVTSAAQLRASLQRSHPEWVTGDTIRLDLLNQASGGPSRGLMGDVAKAVVKRVFTAVLRGDLDSGELFRNVGVDAAVLGLSWAGTKALMHALESKAVKNEGLCAWSDAQGGTPTLRPVETGHFDKYKDERMLVFVHGTASSTLGSFGDLQGADSEAWPALKSAYPGGIYALEHRTLSESPIENAVALVKALPRGARVSLVSHSRGGLVADLLCIRDFGGLIDEYRRDAAFTGLGSAGSERRLPQGSSLDGELEQGHAEQREQLMKLATLLKDKQLTVERYVRVAAPANGTRLASGNFDLFLSSILSLLGLSPWFFGNPLYSAFKRVVLEIANRRTDPHMVPGIEAMLPDSPLARLLREAQVQSGIAMGLIAGDAEGGSALARLGVLLTDFLLFDQVDNDLVVDTPAMLAGIAARSGARALLERSSATTHFRYFSNLDTRCALRDWLVSERPQELPAFVDLPQDLATLEAELERSLQVQTRDAAAQAEWPVVVVLPGVMGSTLKANGERIWLDPLRLLGGGLERVGWGRSGVEADALLALSYGALCKELARTHRVVTFAYDWRQPLDVLGDRLGSFLEQLLKQHAKQPIRLLAHSMGGLVVRACIYRRRAVMDELMAREGARLLMLGTPHRGSHTMVQNLLGKGSMLRALAAMDHRHTLQELLDIVAKFRGALQLLPPADFEDEFFDPGKDPRYDFLKSSTWSGLQPLLKDFWFGDGRMAVPEQDALTEGSWLWRQDSAEATATKKPLALPKEYESKSVYVFGVASNTTCGVMDDGGRLKLKGTTRGDGTVTWRSGRIGNVGRHYYMPAEHGNLCDTSEYFGALLELLVDGSTTALSEAPPVVRAAEADAPLVFDAGPPTVLGDAALAAAAVGGKARTALQPRPRRQLEVSVTATDLRFLTQPVLVGHFELDPIAGPEALIDRELLDGELSRRRALGLYAGPRGTASVVLRVAPVRPLRPGMVRGAVVTGLGRYEQPLNATDLAEAVRAGVLRLLLQLADYLGPDLGQTEFELPLATLLMGYNSSASLSVEASVEALVRGVVEANARFHESTKLRLRVGRLDVVELYLDTAITAVYALRRLAQPGSALSALAQREGTSLVCRRTLRQGQGMRQRLFDNHASAYWPRLMITDAEEPRREAALPPPGTALTPCAQAAAGRPRRGAAIANSLRFVYVGQRARAETVVQQRQPGLIETLVRQQIANPRWDENIGRMLYQLMVPHDFKEAGRQLQRVVLVLDAYTANMPWELMFAADEQPGALQGARRRPLALQTPMVRQLASVQFRRQVRPSVQRTALVVGNPSVAGFEGNFCNGAEPARPLPPLPGAEREATAVFQALRGLGYEVKDAIGADKRAPDVLALLLQRPWRILHIAAHGVFDMLHVDGGRRSGVVLSDGLLITAAEIGAMEWVPELVFLSCCHLGRIDSEADRLRDAERLRDANRLAASVARELIEIGVRCVVVAGWAVSDSLAQQFGEAFYTELLLRRQPFGDAVFNARRTIFTEGQSDITWGAYQAYGDADWRAETAADGQATLTDGPVASPDELLDELAARRAALARRPEALTPQEQAQQRRAIKAMLDERCPQDWRNLPSLQSSLGATWADLGDFESAKQAYECAVRAEDLLGRVPIRDIEQLANMEARLGERQGKPELIELSLERLAKLDQLVSGNGSAAPRVNPERCALRGASLKRLAGLYGKGVLAAGTAAQGAPTGSEMVRTLWRSAAAYRTGEGLGGQRDFRPYNALNRLALQALLLKADGGAPAVSAAPGAAGTVMQDEKEVQALRQEKAEQALELAALCETEARRAFETEPDAWNALMPMDARLVQALLDGSLDDSAPDALSTRERLLQEYRTEFQRLMIKRRELDSVRRHLCQLSRLADALYLYSGKTALWHVAAHMVALAQGLGSSECKRADAVGPDPDAPPSPPPSGGPSLLSGGSGAGEPGEGGKGKDAMPGEDDPGPSPAPVQDATPAPRARKRRKL